MPRRPAFRSVTSRQNRVVTAFREAAAHPSGELVLIEGARLVLEAVRAGWKLQVVAFSPEARDRAAAQPLLELPDDEIDLLDVTRSVIEAMSPAATPSGVVALARRPPSRRDPFDGPAPLVIAACDVQDPGNVGAIIRAAEAAGATGALICGTSAHPFGWKALRGSMGSAFRLPIALYPAADAIAAARSRSIRIVALAAHGGQDLYTADLSGPLAIFAGGEGPGLSADVTAAADQVVTVPMAAPVESLNVAVASAIVLYEAARQRSAKAQRPIADRHP
ncbi:MAG TPA: RNA methyltransferase [Vicinamibacterales bacterium]|nr:RNA methyltransferase [Vicinamibacterales bacterium]